MQRHRNRRLEPPALPPALLIHAMPNDLTPTESILADITPGQMTPTESIMPFTDEQTSFTSARIPNTIHPLTPTNSNAEEHWEDTNEGALGGFSELEKASDRAVENLQAASLAVESFFTQTAAPGVFPF